MAKSSVAEPQKKRQVNVIDRRLKSGSIWGNTTVPIPATEPGRWTFREVNTQISHDHLYQMIHSKQWEYASPGDLACDPGMFAFREQDGRLVKGTHGELVLMKMPSEDFSAVQKEKARVNRVSTFGSAKAAVLAAASSEPDGGRGADLLDRQLQSLTVTDTRERMPLEETD